ncbi:tyrosine-type recombinase/integrase [Tessaracoccus sp. Y1736]
MTTAARRGNHEGSKPIQRKDGRWQIALRYIDAEGLSKRTTVTGKTQKEVRDRAKEVRQRLDKNQPPKDAKVTVAAFTREWIESTLEASERKESTKSLYRTLATKHIAGNKLGTVPLDRMTPRRIEAWVADLRRSGLSQSSIRSIYTVLRAILDTAVRDRVIAENPAAVVTRPKVEHHEAAYLTPDQAKALLAASDSTRYRPLFELMVNTGLRRGEALALTWDRVDEKKDLLKVAGTLARVGGDLVVTEPKTQKSRRVVPMSATVQELMRQLRQRQRLERLQAGSQWQQTDYVFTTEFGQPSDPRNALRALKASAKKAGLPSTVGLHTLRHSAASVMLSNGVPLKVVSEILGHSSISITGDVYGHVSPEVATDALATLGAALS